MGQLDRDVRRSNALLAAELGSLDGLHQVFRWEWSESLITLIPEMDGNDHPVYDIWCACGKNARVHEVSCQGLLRAATRFIRYKVGPDIINRWVLCRWIAPPTLASWKDNFGSTDDYPRNGTYVPISANERRIILSDGIHPNEALTWTVIKVIRSTKSMVELKAEYDRHQAIQEGCAIYDEHGHLVPPDRSATSWWHTRDMLRDQMTTFGQIPGTKESTSYPTPERTKELVN